MSFPERTNRFTFSLHLFDVREANMQNFELYEKINKISHIADLQEKYIKDQLKNQEPKMDEIKEQIQEATEKPAKTKTAVQKRINRIFDKIKIKNKVVVNIQETILNNLLDENSDLIDELSNEKRIVMILDNYSAHISHLAKRVAKFLNIKFVFLPTHSPKLNPIEQVWRSMKKKISSIDFKSIIELSKKLNFYFNKYVKDKTFTEKWMIKFIHEN